MQQLKTIFGFEYFSYLKSKSYIITTIVLMLLAAGLSVVPTVLGMWDRDAAAEADRAVLVVLYEPSDPAVFGESGWLRTHMGTNVHTYQPLEEFFPGYEFTFMDDLDEAKALLGEYSFVLALYADAPDTEEAFAVYVQSITMASLGLENSARRFVTSLWQHGMLAELQADPEQAAYFFDMQPLGSLHAVGGGEAGDFLQNYVYAYVMVFILYLSIAMYGQFITTSVVTEKSSKAMELLITSAKPINLMLGKVLGAVAAGFTQLAAIIAAMLGSLYINSFFWAERSIEVGEEEMALAYQWIATINAADMLARFIYLIIFYLLGFLLYSFMYAAFASTADRMEDINNIQGYPIMILLAAFFIAIFGGMANAGAAWITVASYVPFFMPILMLTRFIMGAAGHAEMLIAIVIMCVSVGLMAYISAKVYRMGVLMYGKKVKLGELVKIIREAKVG